MKTNVLCVGLMVVAVFSQSCIARAPLNSSPERASCDQLSLNVMSDEADDLFGVRWEVAGTIGVVCVDAGTVSWNKAWPDAPFVVRLVDWNVEYHPTMEFDFPVPVTTETTLALNESGALPGTQAVATRRDSSSYELPEGDYKLQFLYVPGPCTSASLKRFCVAESGSVRVKNSRRYYVDE